MFAAFRRGAGLVFIDKPSLILRVVCVSLLRQVSDPSRCYDLGTYAYLEHGIHAFRQSQRDR